MTINIFVIVIRGSRAQESPYQHARKHLAEADDTEMPVPESSTEDVPHPDPVLIDHDYTCHPSPGQYLKT